MAMFGIFILHCYHVISIEGPVVKSQHGIIQVTFNFGETSSSLFNSLGNFHHGNGPMVGRRILHANDSEVMFFG